MSTMHAIAPAGGVTRDEESTCAFCRKSGLDPMPKLKACVQCETVLYCSTNCQEADLPLHKKFCRTVKSIHDVTDDLLRRFIPDPDNWMNRENFDEADFVSHLVTTLSL